MVFPSGEGPFASNTHGSEDCEDSCSSSIMENGEDNCHLHAPCACSRKQKAKFGPNFHKEKELREGSVVSSQGSHLRGLTLLQVQSWLC